VTFWFVFFLCIATKKENEQEQFLIALKYYFNFIFNFYFFYRILSNALFISFLFLRLKRKETNQRKEKERQLKRAFKVFEQKFHPTRGCKFLLKSLKISNKQTSPSSAKFPPSPPLREGPTGRAFMRGIYFFPYVLSSMYDRYPDTF